jgi:hypothetical protein
VGYSVVAYLVPLDQLQRLYGADDNTLIEDIERRLADDIAELNTWLEEDWDIPTPTIEQVIHANIAGQFPWPYEEAPYRAILRLFCKYVGEVLPNAMFGGLSPLGVRFVETEDPHMGMLVFRTKAPVIIPGIEDEDMYRVGHITHNIAAQMLKEREPSHVEQLDCDDPEDWDQCAAAQFNGWLEAAVQTQRAIVTFFD